MNGHYCPATLERGKRFLFGPTRGKYDNELALANSSLAKISSKVPWAITARQILETHVAINKATAPSSVAPDGRGG